jgi:hypothetical protein
MRALKFLFARQKKSRDNVLRMGSAFLFRVVLFPEWVKEHFVYSAKYH